MSWTYDGESQALYVELSDHPIATQVEMPDGVIVDVDNSGEAAGIEVVRVRGPWDLDAVGTQFNSDEDTVTDIRHIAVIASRLRSAQDDRGSSAIVREDFAANSLPEPVPA